VPVVCGAATIGCCDENGASGCCDIAGEGETIPPDEPIPEAKPDWNPAPASANGDGIEDPNEEPAEAGDVLADPRPELSEPGFNPDPMPELRPPGPPEPRPDPRPAGMPPPLPLAGRACVGVTGIPG
jgi:hypothetical protein